MADREELDAVVVGATMRGLVTAYLLSSLGCRAVLVERSASVGGADGSFVTGAGTRFDHGLHVLDAMRSPLTTRLFTHVVDGAVNRVVLRRAIVLRGHVMPYAPRPAEMPAELHTMLPGDELVDDVGDGPPTRERLARCYGPDFADLVLDEVLPSYPAEHRHRAFGVDESLLLANVYPWFFPRAERPVASPDESRAFHDRLRRGIPQEILYPQRGGFGGFAEGFLAKLDEKRVEVVTGAGDLEVEVQPGTHTVESVSAAGRRFTAPHYFWAGPWPALCNILDLPCRDVATDRVVLGSFRLDRPARTDHHEILVGDPRFHVNRVHFPAGFRGSDEALVQVEFAFPAREDGWTLDATAWRERWLDDLGRLGLLDERHRVEDFDFRSFAMHFNGYGAEGEPLVDADPSLLRPDTNVRPVAPSMVNLNLNRYVPGVVRDVTSVLGAPSGGSLRPGPRG